MSPHKPWAKRMHAPENTVEYVSSPGMVRLEVGHVVQRDGGPVVVVKAGPSGAIALPLAGGGVKEFEVLDGYDTNEETGEVTERKKVTKNAKARAVRISGNVPKHLVLGRKDEAWMDEFLRTGKAAGPQGGDGAAKTETNTTNTKEDETMRKNKPVSTAKAARKPASKTSGTNGEASKGALGGVMGFSTTSVLRRLGREGATVAQARGIMDKLKVKAADATVQINVALGRRKDCKDTIAELTAAQVKELMAMAPAEPAAAEDKKDDKK